MDWILMQPTDDNGFITATKLLLETGECLFDLTQGGAHLRLTGFWSRSCLLQESKYHSFVGEAACGRWDIGQNRKYLMGSHSWWLCDCKAVKEILEYDCPIAMMCRWAQKLLGYHFSCLHRGAHVMVDVDGLTRWFGSSVAQHLCIAALLHQIDVVNRSNAYDSIIGDSNNFAQLDPSSHYYVVSIPVLTAHAITSTATNSIDVSSTAITTTSTPMIPPVVSSICSVPILLCHTPS